MGLFGWMVALLQELSEEAPLRVDKQENSGMGWEGGAAAEASLSFVTIKGHK